MNGLTALFIALAMVFYAAGFIQKNDLLLVFGAIFTFVALAALARPR